MRNLRPYPAAALGLLLLTFTMNAQSQLPAPSATPAATRAFAVVGGGCFWCLEAVFENRPGVIAVVSGYAGGHTAAPTYKEVCAEQTGHAEVVRIEFDPTRTSFEDLLSLFWEAHDPTTLNRQGPDEGSQYRSIILYADEAQRVAAEKSRASAQARLRPRIVTEIVPLAKFHEAEAYHQDYFRRNPDQAYCRISIAPKIKKLEKWVKPVPTER